jgi:hypothetical protein
VQLLAKLRNTTGRTTEVIAAFKRVADRLERQQQNRLGK